MPPRTWGLAIASVGCLLAALGLATGLQLQGYDTDTVLPTVIVADANGRILFADQTDDDRVRPEPEIFLGILESA